MLPSGHVIALHFVARVEYGVIVMTWHDMLWLIEDELCHVLELDL